VNFGKKDDMVKIKVPKCPYCGRPSDGVCESCLAKQIKDHKKGEKQNEQFRNTG